MKTRFAVALALVIALAPAATGGTLVAHYALDGSAHDSSGHGFGATVYGSPTFGHQGPTGASAYFSGDGSTILTPALPLDFGGGGNSVSFWMNWSGVDSQMPVSLHHDYDLWLNGGRFGFNTGNGDDIGIQNAALQGSWHFIAAYFPNNDPSAYQLYLDGTRQSLDESQGGIIPRPATDGIFQLSGWDANGGYAYQGYLADVSIYTGQITAQQAQPGSSVPEPASLALCAAGLAVWTSRRRS